MALRSLFFVSFLLLDACDCGVAGHARAPDAGEPPGCSDPDGDGFGVGCECDALEPQACYGADPSTIGVAGCRGGFATCTDGTWGPCDGQILPMDEACNGRDDDCDGEVDDGVLEECGICGECGAACAGPDAECQPWGEAREHLVETADGGLTLDATAADTLHVIWPSGASSGEVLEIDTRTLEIEGDYWTGPNHAGALGQGDSPSRSAVTREGDLLIANRAMGGDGLASVTRIAASLDDCIDRNENGVIDTSTGWNDRLAFDGHERWDDECIQWHRVVGDDGGVNAIARGIALRDLVGLDGAIDTRAWIALYTNQKFVELDAASGVPTGAEAPTPNFSPYGAAIDREGFVWATDFFPALFEGQSVGHFDTESPEDSWELTPAAVGGGGIRILVDENDVPWVSGGDVFRFDRDTETWEPVGIPDIDGIGGVGHIASDGLGSIWAGAATLSEQCYRIDRDTLEARVIPTPGTMTFGAAVDFDGHAWFFGLFTSNATIVDLETEETELVLNDCEGTGCLYSPYIRGDITGMQRHLEIDPEGEWSGVFEGCAGGRTDWKRVEVDASTPVGAFVEVSVRTAEDLASLATAAWTRLGTLPADGELFDLDVALDPDGDVLEVRATLRSTEEAAPTLHRVDVTWGCPESVD